MKKVGIMGGTFDPIHIGHLILGENAYQQLGLDRVVFMPSGNPPHKRDRDGRASDEQRMDMVKLAIASNTHFKFSSMEMNEDGYSYTYLTLEKLNEKHPDTRYYFIIGADSLFDFKGWRNPQRICDACTLVVATRNHTSDEELDKAIEDVRQTFGADIVKLNTENIDVSSHQLRDWIAAGKTVKYYAPDEVINYIKSYHVYDGLAETVNTQTDA
ncbi:MAG: nicotinate-nucleotide adenylyltransferase [Lachnospiraceae bacterium]|nr:nicotinate-nucleotide adenylyltransferase [Lachnospiraceae bacterium]